MPEERTTSSTGGQKGVKLQRFDLVPVGPLTELAEHYGVGASKYANHQWRQGYEWSKSYAALQRHLTAFWDGFDFDVCSNDPDGCRHTDLDGNAFVAVREDACFNHTGSHHMAAVAWHAFCLLELKDRYPEHDDRYSTQVSNALETAAEEEERILAEQAELDYETPQWLKDLFTEHVEVVWRDPTPTYAFPVRFIAGIAGGDTEDLRPARTFYEVDFINEAVNRRVD